VQQEVHHFEGRIKAAKQTKQDVPKTSCVPVWYRDDVLLASTE
jgi:hypothetical protein